MAQIVCIGWISIDFIAEVDGLPDVGTFAQAQSFDVACGGRAASQAMALRAVEADVKLIARIGDDYHADVLKEELEDLGIDDSAVEASPTTTGVRLVTRSSNTLMANPGAADAPVPAVTTVVHRGANDYLGVDDLNRRSELLKEAAAVGVTTEPAGAVVHRALEICEGANVPTVLTYHPGLPVSDRVLSAATLVVTSNATCLGLLDPELACNQPDHAVRAMLQRGAKAVALLTPESAVFGTATGIAQVVSPGRLDHEDAVDAFVAGVLMGMAEGQKLDDSVLRGVRTSCLLVD